MLLGLIWESEKPLCIDYIFGFFRTSLARIKMIFRLEGSPRSLRRIFPGVKNYELTYS